MRLAPTIDNIGDQYQIVIVASDGSMLYSQELVGDGYDEYILPFDLYVIDFASGDFDVIDQNVVEGDGFKGDDAIIDWEGLIKRAYDDDMAEGLYPFAMQWDACAALDADEVEDMVERLMDASIL